MQREAQAAADWADLNELELMHSIHIWLHSLYTLFLNFHTPNSQKTGTRLADAIIKAAIVTCTAHVQDHRMGLSINYVTQKMAIFRPRSPLVTTRNKFSKPPSPPMSLRNKKKNYIYI